MPVDYDALAKQFGGTAGTPAAPASGGAGAGQPDYESLAKEFGGTTVSGSLAADPRAGLYQGPPQVKPTGLWNRITDPIGENSLSREISGDIHNMYDALSSSHPIRDLIEGAGGGDPSGIKNPAAGTGTKIAAAILEMLSGRGIATGSLSGTGAVGVDSAGPMLSAMAAEPTIAKLASPVAKLAAITSKLKILEENPWIERALGRAAHAGTSVATQDVLQGKGAKQAAIEGGEAAAIAPVATPVLNKALNVAGAGLRKAGQATVARFAPTTTDIAGVPFPVLQSQVDKAGNLTGVTAGGEGAARMERAQQPAAQQVITNVARDGVRKVINQVNESRPAMPVGRLLTAGEPTAAQAPAYAYNVRDVMSQGAAPPQSSEPFVFTLRTTPAVEETTGTMAQSAAKVPGRAAFKEPQYTTASAPTRERIHPGGPLTYEEASKLPTANEGQQGADIRTATTPEPGADTARGGGVVQTPNPHEAEQWLQHYEDFEKTPEYRDMPEADRAQVDADHKLLRDQLGMYHSSPAQRFHRIDPDTVAAFTDSFGDAARHSQATAEPGYQILDSKSNGAFGRWRDVANNARAVIQRGGSMEAIEAAQERLDEANAEVDNLINRHSADVSRHDYTAMKTAWRHGVTFDDLHDITRRMANGVTLDEQTKFGLPRVIKGKPNLFDNYLAKETSGISNYTRVQELIGDEGIANMKKMMLLTRDAELARKSNSLWRNVGEFLATSTTGGWVGGHIPFVPYQVGQAIGATAAGTTYLARKAFVYAATDPRVGDWVDYAIRHDVRPEIYKPLIGSYIARALTGGKQEQPGQGQQEQEPAETKP